MPSLGPTLDASIRSSAASLGDEARLIYCDHNATAPIRAAAFEATTRWLAHAGNASSSHTSGQRAATAVEQARGEVASLIGARSGEIVFTSGATEANNVALHAALQRREGSVLVTSTVEHPAVLAIAETRPARSHLVRVDADGNVDIEHLTATLRKTPTAVVSVMAANNETGVLTDLATVVSAARAFGAMVHTDATQMVGRLPLDVTALDVDLLSLSAHKFGGPTGVGALFVSRAARLPVLPSFHGGGQERGWRPGTLNVAGIAGMGAAAAEVADLMDVEIRRITAIRDAFEERVLVDLPSTRVNGARNRRLPGVSNVLLGGLPADAVLAAMPSVAASDGSACTSGAPHPSHVLLAMGRTRDEADSSLRFSFGHSNEPLDGKHAATRLLGAVRNVSAAVESPLALSTGKSH